MSAPRSTSRTIRVDLAGRAYDIVIGPDLIDRVGELSRPLLAAPRVTIVSDDTVAPLYGARLAASFDKAGVKATIVTVPAGESSKEFASFGRLMNELLDHRPDRRTTLVALGGGVVGDLTGFAASVLLRGVDFIQVPTTLLAQVDSSVGGKTGINTRHGKNLVGTFYQPRLVVADTAVLDSLPETMPGGGRFVTAAPATVQSLQVAGNGRRRAEASLLAPIATGEAALTELHPTLVSAIIVALRQVGEDNAGRLFAIEIAIAHGM